MTTLIPKYDQGATDAVNRPFNQKLAETVSIKDFGAVGDGNVDDAAAIQAAFDSGAASIYIPKGTYSVGATLVIPDTVCKIYGEGNDSKLYSATANGDYLIELTSAQILLQDFRLYGGEDGVESFPTLRNGVNANVAGSRGNWTNVLIYGFATGAYIGTVGSNTYMYEFNHCDFTDCTTGMRVIQGFHQSSWINCVFRSCVNYGLHIQSASTSSENVALGIYNCTFERTSSGTGAGLWLQNVRGVDVSACYFEGNVGKNIYIYGTSTNGLQGVTIHNCYIFEYSSFAGNGNGIEVAGPYVDGITIANNHFEGFETANYYPIALGNYSGYTTIIENNVFNNCTGNSYQIQTDLGYYLTDKGAINNHTIVRNAGKTDGAGALASLNIGKFSLGNSSASCIVKVTTIRVTDNVSSTVDETVNYIRAVVSTGAVAITSSSGAPTGVTFVVGTTGTYGASYNADLNVSVTGGVASCNMGFIAEIVCASNGAFVGTNVTSTTYS